MSELAKLRHRQLMQSLVIEGQDRVTGEAIFTEWRDRYVAQLCAYIRLQSDAKRRGLPLPEITHSAEWCNAAVSILTLAPYEIQDEFLRADAKTKDKFVQAVIDDHGIVDHAGHFNELPPL